jgi:organic hydroperoxide reductase OsmC/OhrA
MKPYPHLYSVSARGSVSGSVPVAAPGLPELATAPPVEFDGPGDVWSPETLLVAAVADCFILTFRALALNAGLGWVTLECSVDGVVERVGGLAQFARFTTRARLTVRAGMDHTKAREVLERAEKFCLISNSLRGERSLQAEVVDQS